MLAVSSSFYRLRSQYPLSPTSPVCLVLYSDALHVLVHTLLKSPFRPSFLSRTEVHLSFQRIRHLFSKRASQHLHFIHFHLSFLCFCYCHCFHSIQHLIKFSFHSGGVSSYHTSLRSFFASCSIVLGTSSPLSLMLTLTFSCCHVLRLLSTNLHASNLQGFSPASQSFFCFASCFVAQNNIVSGHHVPWCFPSHSVGP